MRYGRKYYVPENIGILVQHDIIVQGVSHDIVRRVSSKRLWNEKMEFRNNENVDTSSVFFYSEICGSQNVHFGPLLY